jgi:hypothetical protein
MATTVRITLRDSNLDLEYANVKVTFEGGFTVVDTGRNRKIAIPADRIVKVEIFSK